MCQKCCVFLSLKHIHTHLVYSGVTEGAAEGATVPQRIVGEWVQLKQLNKNCGVVMFRRLIIESTW